MALPRIAEQFPSPEWSLAFAQYDSNDAWYSGDQRKLQAVYAALSNAGTDRGDNPTSHYNRGPGNARRSGGIRGFMARFFNGQPQVGQENRTRIHAPIAGNLATLSSDLLMAEPPTFRLVNSTGADSGRAIKGDTQNRLDEILNGEDTHRTLSHAAELTAGLSATVLTANWDTNVSDMPWMDVATCDAAIPEFVGRKLVAVNLYTAYPQLDGTGSSVGMYFHIERHEIGVIIHALAKASIDGKISTFVPLGEITATAHIPDIPGSRVGQVENTIELPTGLENLTAQWWRNLPTKTYRREGVLSMMGRADFEGIEQMLDAGDEVWSSWMRDIKIARARLIVPETFLDVQGPGLGGAFDDDRELLTALQFTDLSADGQKISAQQFEIRAEEHAGTLLALTKEIVQHAGYSLSSYGEQQSAGGTTATEVTDRTTLTERTRDKKFLYFAQAMRPIADVLMEIDTKIYKTKAAPAGAQLSIEIPELSQIDPEKEARIFQYLRTAMAASTDTLVRTQHPEWDEAEILREIATIREENNLAIELDPGAVDNVDPNAPQEDPANPGFDMEGNPMPTVTPAPEPAPDPAPVPA